MENLSQKKETYSNEVADSLKSLSKYFIIAAVVTIIIVGIIAIIIKSIELMIIGAVVCTIMWIFSTLIEGKAEIVQKLHNIEELLKK